MEKNIKFQETALKQSKRTAILDCALIEFTKGYDSASTLSIIRMAGVSKGLLFHYFGTKKDLYCATYDYAVNLIVSEFYDLISPANRDILERIQQIALLKMDLYSKHPGLFAFLTNATYNEKSPEVAGLVNIRDSVTSDFYKRFLKGIDYSLFREDVDTKTAIDIIFFTVNGYAESVGLANKSVAKHYEMFDDYLKELNRFIDFFRQSFYKYTHD